MRGWWLGLALAASVAVGACAPRAGAPAASPGAGSTGDSAAASQAAAAPAARPAPAAKVRAAYGTDSGGEVALWVAHEAGLFAEYGLDVSLERFAGGTSKPTQVMIAGELDVMHGA